MLRPWAYDCDWCVEKNEKDCFNPNIVFMMKEFECLLPNNGAHFIYHEIESVVTEKTLSFIFCQIETDKNRQGRVIDQRFIKGCIEAKELIEATKIGEIIKEDRLSGKMKVQQNDEFVSAHVVLEEMRTIYNRFLHRTAQCRFIFWAIFRSLAYEVSKNRIPSNYSLLTQYSRHTSYATQLYNKLQDAFLNWNQSLKNLLWKDDDGKVRSARNASGSSSQ